MSNAEQESASVWYSVKDAAKYLGVSQPTIFRWMKDGMLSYYKVGGSTRFSQADLDAVVEKNTSRREAQEVRRHCAACGHHELADGRLQSTGVLYFKPAKTRFWVFSDSLVNLQATVCTACGFVQLHADTSKLRRLKPDGGETEADA
jgi:excisionase family DNA binding protein